MTRAPNAGSGYTLTVPPRGPARPGSGVGGSRRVCFIQHHARLTGRDVGVRASVSRQKHRTIIDVRSTIVRTAVAWARRPRAVRVPLRAVCEPDCRTRASLCSYVGYIRYAAQRRRESTFVKGSSATPTAPQRAAPYDTRYARSTRGPHQSPCTVPRPSARHKCRHARSTYSMHDILKDEAQSLA